MKLKSSYYLKKEKNYNSNNIKKNNLLIFISLVFILFFYQQKSNLDLGNIILENYNGKYIKANKDIKQYNVDYKDKKNISIDYNIKENTYSIKFKDNKMLYNILSNFYMIPVESISLNNKNVRSDVTSTMLINKDLNNYLKKDNNLNELIIKAKTKEKIISLSP